MLYPDYPESGATRARGRNAGARDDVQNCSTQRNLRTRHSRESQGKTSQVQGQLSECFYSVNATTVHIFLLFQ